jgi:hypothetical protein
LKPFKASGGASCSSSCMNCGLSCPTNFISGLAFSNSSPR